MSKDGEEKKEGSYWSWKLFPREWEGTHEAFPVCPPEVDHRGPTLLPGPAFVMFGAVGGLVVEGVRALRGNYLRGSVLNWIGIATIPAVGLSFWSDHQMRKEVLPDIRAILAADGKTLPKRQYIKQVPAKSIDQQTLTWGCISLLGLAIYRRAPNARPVGPLAAIGAFTIGQWAGMLFHMSADTAPATIKAVQQFEVARTKGSLIYAQRTGKPPPADLYGHEMRGTESALWASAAPPSDSASHSYAFPGMTAGLGDMGAEMPEMSPSQPERQPGAEPHVMYVNSDGKKAVLAIRDYEWNPATRRDGLEFLQDHLDELQKMRKENAELAQYLWAIIADREAKNWPTHARDQESHAIILEKKALELLASLHKSYYTQITDLDWCIASTQKALLQLESDGKWVPTQNETDLQPAAEVHTKLLGLVTTHKKNLEVQNMTMEETLKILDVPDEEKAEIRESVAGNLAATKKLLDDLEKRR